MTKELITTETILGFLKDNIEQKISVSPSVYVDAAQKLVVLLSDEHEKLFSIQQKVAQAKAELMSEGSTAANAKIMIEATDDYKNYQLQKAKIGRIEEFIRIAKLQSRIKMEEYKSY